LQSRRTRFLRADYLHRTCFPCGSNPHAKLWGFRSLTLFLPFRPVRAA
jgi:hypothetical protein